MPHIIALTGRPKSGKDTMALALDGTGAFTQRLSFAKALRDVAEVIFGKRYETHEEKEAVDEFWDPILRNTGSWGEAPITGRRILQFLGTDVFRSHVHKDIWILRAERAFRSLPFGTEYAVFTDCRYPNEAEWARAHDGLVVKMRNPFLPEPAGDEAHECENGLPEHLIDVHVTCYSVPAIRNAAKLIVAGFRDGRYLGPSHILLRT